MILKGALAVRAIAIQYAFYKTFQYMKLIDAKIKEKCKRATNSDYRSYIYLAKIRDPAQQQITHPIFRKLEKGGFTTIPQTSLLPRMTRQLLICPVPKHYQQSRNDDNLKTMPKVGWQKCK